MPATDSSTATEPASRSRAIFVVGAGRSGTSAITRGLQALGVELGDRLKAPTDKNPTGFFEDRDLLRIAKRMRAEGTDTPVIILSAKRSVDDRIRGLQAGGDDYMVKPLSSSQ